jgi:sulfide:quinone oxidoreductase
MSTWLASPDERPRVLIAGGGVAALEACLLLRDHVAADDVDIEILTPAQHFTYRPLSVLEPVGGPRTWSMPLVRFASDQDAEVVHDELSAVHPDERTITTTAGAERRYDLLLVAIGARPVQQLPGAVTFYGAVDAPVIRRMLDDAARLRHAVAFAVGAATSWPLPLYELALLAATDLRARGAKARLTLVTPEATPLALFGAEASSLVAQLLDDHGIEVVCEAEPLAAENGRLRLIDGRRLLADRVVTLPRPAGRFVGGLPHDSAGFIPVDPHGRVDAFERVYAAGRHHDLPAQAGRSRDPTGRCRRRGDARGPRAADRSPAVLARAPGDAVRRR